MSFSSCFNTAIGGRFRCVNENYKFVEFYFNLYFKLNDFFFWEGGG